MKTFAGLVDARVRQQTGLSRDVLLGVSIGDRADVATWRVSMAEEASAEELAAAQAAIAAIDPEEIAAEAEEEF